MPRRRQAFDCPHCGVRVPVGALSCRACGSDAASGWSEDAEAWAGDLPVGYGDDEEDEEDEDVDANPDAEPGRRATRRRSAGSHGARRTLVVVIALLLLLAILKRVLRVH